MTNEEWPTREEWLQGRRTLYLDEHDSVTHEISNRASAYGSPEEIAEIRDVLLKAARSYPIGNSRRDELNKMRRDLKKDNLPLFGDAWDWVPASMRALYKRWRDAWDTAIEAERDRRAALPDDDAAWAEELRRRAEIERYLADKSLRFANAG